MAYTPPAANAVNFTITGSYTSPAANAVNFALSDDGLTGLQNMKLDIAAGAFGCADTMLDLSAYYRTIEDARLDILLVVTALSDFILDVNLTDGIMLIDTMINLAAYYQTLEDAKVDIETWGDNTQDAKVNGWAAAWGRKDQKLDTFAGLENLEIIKMSIISAMETSNINAMLDMCISDGDSMHDVLLDIEVSDGVLLHDAGLDLAVIEIAPTFKAVYAMHLDSVITEI